MKLGERISGMVGGLLPQRKAAPAAAPKGPRSTFSITVGDGDDEPAMVPLAKLDIIQVPASQAIPGTPPVTLTPVEPAAPARVRATAPAEPPPVERRQDPARRERQPRAPVEPPVLTERLPVRERREPETSPERAVVAAAPTPVALPLAGGAPLRPPLSIRLPLIVGLSVILLGGVGFVGWAATAPLAEGVPAEGYVKIETSRKTVQHLRGGIVESILIRDGDAVKANQVLFKLNDTEVRGRMQSIESRLMAALALEARLLSERRSDGQLVFPPELTAHAGTPAADEAMRTQQQLFNARRTGVYTDVAIQSVNTSSLESYVRGLQADAQAKTEQIALLNQELKSQRDLAAQGYVPRVRVSELERQVLLMQGQLSEVQGNIGRVRGSISESRLKVTQRRTDVSKDVETQLTEVQSRVNDLREQMTSLREEFERMVIRAPGDGVVVDLQVHTVGAVINPSQRLLDVVPAREPLIVEAQVPARLFDNLRAGMVCDVRFTGPDQSVTRPVKGTVTYVAPDRSIDPARGDSYFVTRVQVTDQALADANLKVMQPGMPATVMITTAERSLLHYLVSPLMKRLPGALAER